MIPILKSFASIKRAKLFVIMILCIALALLTIAAGVIAITWLTDHYVQIEKGWVDTLINWVVAVLSGVGGWFLIPVFTVIIAGFFQESIIAKVEKAYYPTSKQNTGLNFWIELWESLKFTIYALVLNILILPLFLLGIGFAISIALNSYLLGREFFEGVAAYHHGRKQAVLIFKENKKIVLLNGLVITVLSLIPVVNLVVPIIATALMVHVFHLPNVKKTNNELSDKKL